MVYYACKVGYLANWTYDEKWKPLWPLGVFCV